MLGMRQGDIRLGRGTRGHLGTASAQALQGRFIVAFLGTANANTTATNTAHTNACTSNANGVSPELDDDSRGSPGAQASTDGQQHTSEEQSGSAD